ncbi:MAG: hypothetical protein AAFQ98_05805 [Bacteroidota bacterium]
MAASSKHHPHQGPSIVTKPGVYFSISKASNPMKNKNQENFPVQGTGISRNKPQASFHLDTEEQQNDPAYCARLSHAPLSSRCLISSSLW